MRTIGELVVFMMRSEIETMLRKEKEKVSSVCLDLKSSYSVDVVAKSYLVGMSLHNFRSLMIGKEIRRSTLFASFFHRSSCQQYISMPKRFSKSLMDRAYIWYVNLKPGFVHDGGQIVSLTNKKFFFVEAKFTLAELGRTCLYP